MTLLGRVTEDLWDIEQLLALGGADVVRAVDAVVGQLPASSRALWEPFRSRADGKQA